MSDNPTMSYGEAQKLDLDVATPEQLNDWHDCMIGNRPQDVHPGLGTEALRASCKEIRARVWGTK